jgi:hypothetical protein
MFLRQFASILYQLLFGISHFGHLQIGKNDPFLLRWSMQIGANGLGGKFAFFL